MFAATVANSGAWKLDDFTTQIELPKRRLLTLLTSFTLHKRQQHLRRSRSNPDARGGQGLIRRKIGYRLR
jgi:hypothetical protein